GRVEDIRLSRCGRRSILALRSAKPLRHDGAQAACPSSPSRHRGGDMPRASVSSVRFTAPWLASFALIASSWALADETCNSPYVGNLIKGQEDYVYVWTLGIKGLGDGSDKLVTIDADPSSKTYGKVVHKASVGRRGEAHHMGLTDDRRFLWAGGLDDSRIYVFDIGKNPAKPRLVKTIADLPGKTGYVGPHTF